MNIKCDEKEGGTIGGLDADGWQLVSWIPDVDRVKAYIRELARCHRINDVIARVISPMIFCEPTITIDLVSTKCFYETMLPLMKGVERGKSLSSWRSHILDFSIRLKKYKKVK